MSKAKQLVEQYLNVKAALHPAGQRQWARKTSFTHKGCGRVERRMARADGTVGHKAVDSGQEWWLVGTRAKTVPPQA